MRFKQRVKVIYRGTLLPALRGAATPLFRLAVKLAVVTGVLPRRSSSTDPKPAHYLIVHLSNHVGDTVMLLPMIEALRAAHPHARIECVVQIPIGPFLRLVPSLDRVYEFDLGYGPTSTPWLEVQRTVAILEQYGRTLRHVQPTTCIVPRWGCGFRDLMLAYLSQAPNRVGFASNDFDRSQPPAGYRDALLTSRVSGAQRMMEPARFLFLLEQASLIPSTGRNAACVRPSSSMRHIAATIKWPTLAARLRLEPDARLVVIAPGASASRRIWPIDRWATVIAQLHLDGFAVVLMTGTQDAPFARELYNLVPATERNRIALVAGSTTLSESTCLIAHSQLFIGNDSGPGHIAGALGVPCVILFIAAEGADPDGPSAPERVRPMGERVVCCRPAQAVFPCSGYCTADHPHCILQIEPEAVITAARSLLNQETISHAR